MPSAAPRTAEFVEGLSQLWVKSVQANLRLAQNSAEALRILGSQPRAREQARPVLSDALADYARAGLQQAGQWLDLQLALSNEIVARLGGTTSSRTQEAEPRTAPAIVDLLLKVSPGSEGETGFLIENSRPQLLAATLVASDLVSPATGTKLNAAPHLEPATLSLQPGEKVRATVKLAVPATAAPGNYVGTIWLTGCDDIQCRLTVNVEKPADGPPVEKTAPAPGTGEKKAANPAQSAASKSRQGARRKRKAR